MKLTAVAVNRAIASSDVEWFAGLPPPTTEEADAFARLEMRGMPGARKVGFAYHSRSPLLFALWRCLEEYRPPSLDGAVFHRSLSVLRLVVKATPRPSSRECYALTVMVTLGGDAAARLRHGLPLLTDEQKDRFARVCLPVVLAEPGWAELEQLMHRLLIAPLPVTFRWLLDRFPPPQQNELIWTAIRGGLVLEQQCRVVLETLPLPEGYERGMTLLHAAAYFRPTLLPELLPRLARLATARDIHGRTPRMALDYQEDQRDAARGGARRLVAPAMRRLREQLMRAEDEDTPAVRGALVLASARGKGEGLATLSMDVLRRIMTLVVEGEQGRMLAPPSTRYARMLPF